MVKSKGNGPCQFQGSAELRKSVKTKMTPIKARAGVSSVKSMNGDIASNQPPPVSGAAQVPPPFPQQNNGEDAGDACGKRAVNQWPKKLNG